MNIDVSAEDLLARTARQDVDALSELYDRYAPRVYGVTTHILSSREAAEDVLQAAFLRLWNEGSSLSQEGGSVLAWLVITARGLAVERLRAQSGHAPSADPPRRGTGGAKPRGAGARKARATVLLSAEGTSDQTSDSPRLLPAKPVRTPADGAIPPGWLPRPKEIALIDERLTLLHKVIDQLPEPQQQALELAVFQGLSESEIAVQMHEPLGKIQRSLRAAVTFVKHRRRAVCGTWAANI